MRIHEGQKTTTLRTFLTFAVIDRRGENGFPEGQTGFMFGYIDPGKNQYVIRIDGG